MKNRALTMLGVAMAALLSGCATNGTAGPAIPASATGKCSPDALGSFVGQKATAEVGAHMLSLTGARLLRWVPPRTAVTMDFREDRLTFSYDDNMVIIQASCG